MKGNLWVLAGFLVLMALGGSVIFKLLPKIAALTKQVERMRRSGGIMLIAAERIRQIDEEDFDERYDRRWTTGQLTQAAMCYAAEDIRFKGYELYHKASAAEHSEPLFWPWNSRWWKPKDRKRNLVKAGALIAAEIDRLEAEEKAQ